MSLRGREPQVRGYLAFLAGDCAQDRRHGLSPRCVAGDVPAVAASRRAHSQTVPAQCPLGLAYLRLSSQVRHMLHTARGSGFRHNLEPGQSMEARYGDASR